MTNQTTDEAYVLVQQAVLSVIGTPGDINPEIKEREIPDATVTMAADIATEVVRVLRARKLLLPIGTGEALFSSWRNFP